MLIKIPSKQTSSSSSFNGSSSSIKIMTLAAIASSLSRRHVVRAFSSHGLPSSMISGSSNYLTTAGTNARRASNSMTVLLSSKREASHHFSTTASDRELEMALDDLLSDVTTNNNVSESIVGGELETSHHSDEENGGHRDFPKELIDVEKEHDYTDPKFLSTSNPHWTNIGLPQSVIDVLSHKGITHLTPVQAKAISPVLAGRDVIGRSRTGTGKTLAFGMPSAVRLVKEAINKGNCELMEDGSSVGRMKRGRLPSMIVMCPTRELARQVEGELREICKPLGLFTEVFHGGVSYDPQARALRNGVDIVVGTPGRVIDHLERGNLRLDECNIVVLDEADEMLNMGFAEDVEVILEGVGNALEQKTQVLLFSATTPPWVKEIGSNYQENVLSIDITGQAASRTATTVRHVAIQVPFGAKKDMLEDIIAVEISKDLNLEDTLAPKQANAAEGEEDEYHNPIAEAAKAAKSKASGAFQQKLFGKTIVFTETKAECDELVSGGVFKTLTAQAIHGDIGQKQRDATLAAFRAGAFNVLVATDVAARGIDIKDVDLVIQFQPPRDNDVYVHRSGRTGRAGAKGISVLLFQQNQARDIVRIERSLGHGFKFDLQGPPSSEAALNAAAKTSAIACQSVADETAEYFREAASSLLANSDKDPEDVVARCLAAIARRTVQVESRSLLTGESGYATVEMSNNRGRNVSPADVMFTVNKLSKMSRDEGGDLVFDSDIGKIQTNHETGSAMFDMGVEDAKKMLEFSKDIDAGGAVFTIMKEMEINRGRDFGQQGRGGRGGRGEGRGGYGRGGGRGYGRGGGRGGGYSDRFSGGGGRFSNRYEGGRNNRYEGGRNNRYDDGGYGGGRRSYSSGPRPTRNTAPRRQPRNNDW